MKNPPQQRDWISRIRPAGASAALMLATVLMLAVVTTASAQAQTFTTLFSFDLMDGANPYSSLIQATDGNFYGTTYGGGANNNSSCIGVGNGVPGCGTIFKITPSGTLTTLYSFCSQSNCTDGAQPTATLVQATNGNLYGTTVYGGANTTDCFGFGCGTVFKITLGGSFTTVHSFDNTDGANASGRLVQATDGNLYGTTEEGGTELEGTVFKITLGGALTTLYSFCSQSQGGNNCTDGAQPVDGLVQATDGNFYGTTRYGGPNASCDNDNGCGTVFKITPSGKQTTLYSFCSQSSCTDGYHAEGQLVQASNGDLYGMTSEGGANTTECFGAGCGTVFKTTLGGTLTTLYSFCPQTGCSDGYYPAGGVVQATDGNLYGMVPYGGANGEGTLFKITPGGTLTTLYSFDFSNGGPDLGGLVQDTNGILYGMTYNGGVDGYGTLFSLSVGLGSFVETQPTSGKVGAAVKILGTNLTGATSVTFNGTAATFTVVSKSEISTKVPTGATTGTVKVKIPGRTLNSNTKFVVTP